MRLLSRVVCRAACLVAPAFVCVLAAVLCCAGLPASAQTGAMPGSSANVLPESKTSSQSHTSGVLNAPQGVSKAGIGTQHTPQPLLPAAFDGRPREGSIIMSGSAVDADSAHAAVLKEDGLTEAGTVEYRGVGVVGWHVQLLQFGDATGALSAFTFYRQPGMQVEQVGDNAAANATTFLVQRAASLVIVRAAGASSETPEGNAMRLRSAVQSLLTGIPRVQGPEGVLPALPGLLPAQNLAVTTMHYAVGPASYNGAIPVSAIDFSRDAEVVTALYRLPSGAPGLLTLIMLPTPQIAHAQEQSIARLPDAASHVAARRIGPLLGVVSGQGVAAADAQALLAQLHYKAEVTVDDEAPQGPTEIAKTAQLLLGIAYLTGLLAIASLVIAVFLGAGRVMIRRMRGKPDSSMNDDDFISLKL